MNRSTSRHRWLTTAVVTLLVLTALAGWQISLAPAAPAGPAIAPMGPSGGDGAAAASAAAPVTESSTGTGILVGQSTQNDLSPALRDIPPIQGSTGAPPRVAEDRLELIPLVGHKDVPDAVAQTSFHPGASDAPAAMPGPATNWAGINQAGGCGNCAPPDTNGEAGATQYVQTVNTSFAVWSKTGTLLYGPAHINTIWSGFGGPCETRNDGDPVVLYDQIANRWVISQFTAASPYNECVAVSQTSDATGAWYRYAFQLSTSAFPDYPKLGVWPDGYYMSVNQFNNGSTYAGPRPYVFNRSQMLAGAAATFQTTANALGSSVSPILPADLDGSTLPPSGAPNYFVGFGSTMPVYKFHVDWATPGNTTWSTVATLTPAGFTQLCGSTQNCVPQPSTSQKVDGLADRLMHRLAYRNFGDHESLVVNHSVSVSSHAAVRWMRSAARAAARRSISKAATRPIPPGAGWARSRWTTSATWPSATARRARASTRPCATPAASPLMHWAPCRRAK